MSGRTTFFAIALDFSLAACGGEAGHEQGIARKKVRVFR